MAYDWRAPNKAVDSLLRFLISAGHAVVLAQVLSPGGYKTGGYKKSLHITSRILSVAKDLPLIGAVTPRDALYSCIAVRNSFSCSGATSYSTVTRTGPALGSDSGIRTAGNRQCAHGVRSATVSGSFRNNPKMVLAIDPAPAHIGAPWIPLFRARPPHTALPPAIAP